MDSESLATFLAVHRGGGVSAAAVTLSRTQSAISRRLALLERQLGAPLFDRIGRGLVLNDVGAALLPYAERAGATLADARAAVDAARAGSAGAVRLAVVGTLANAALAQVLARFRAASPGADLRIQTATSAQVSAGVRAGEVTLGLRYFEDPAADLQCRVVQHERLVVACAAAHPLAGKRLKALAQLARERWLAFPVQESRPETFAQTIFAQFLSRGIGQVDWTPIDSLTAQKRLVEAGYGIALLQQHAIEEELARRQLAVIKVGDLDLRVPVVCVVRRGGYLGGAAQLLLRELLRGTRK